MLDAKPRARRMDAGDEHAGAVSSVGTGSVGGRVVDVGAQRVPARGREIGDLVGPLVVVAALLVVWEVYVRAADVSPLVLPSPSRILGALLDFRDLAWTNTLPTVAETLVGFAVSVVAAVAAAIGMDQV